MSYSLLIMAGGMGSRYGGLKQVDSFGPNNEAILDYSIYDAISAGFNKIVILSSPKLQDYFEKKYKKIFSKISSVSLEIVIQDPRYGIGQKKFPKNRIKPWGTGHAVLCCENVIDETFAIINADDFYGKGAFNKILETLKYIDSKNIKASIVSYLIENTLSSYGGVSRGVCKTERNKLIDIKETHELKKYGNKVKGIYENKEIKFPNGTQVAMNLIGFQKSIFSKLNKYFTEFLEKNISEEKKEFLIPDIVGDLISENVYVDITDENWFGVTYKKDCEIVKNKIKDLVTKKVYPSPLWK